LIPERGSTLTSLTMGAAPNRGQLVLLQTLVTIILSYQLLLSQESLLIQESQLYVILGLMGIVAILAALPARIVEAVWFVGGLVLVDTLATSFIIYLAGNAGYDLYLTYFLIILISGFAQTLQQKIALSVLVCVAYAVLLYLEADHGQVLVGHLIRMPVLLVMAVFYAVVTQSARTERQEKTDLLEYIAERSQSEEAVRASEERFRKTFEDAPIGMAIMDLDYRFVVVNRTLSKMLGYTAQELTGKKFVEIAHPDDVQKQVASTEQVFKGELPNCSLEMRYLRKGQETVWVVLTATVIRYQDGRPLYGLAMMLDVTDRKRMEEQLRQSDKLAALGTLVSGVAHELNNPLFILSGYIQLAKEKVSRGQYEGLAADLEGMQDGAQRASSIVERFLGVARSSSGQPRPCSVNEVLSRTLDLVRNDLAIRRIEVRTDFLPELPPVLADPHELGRVFLNLFNNASQAMSSANGRGVLTVTTSLHSDAGKPSVEVRVSDDGPGIAREHLPRIFEPFFTTKPVGEGTGLGLAICYRTVTELGGTIACQSKPGHGATFTVRLLAQPVGVPVPDASSPRGA
jgi:two-component system NtrC family sensor kinase